MAYDKKPISWFGPALPANADGENGDAALVIDGVMAQLQGHYAGLAAADRPQNMRITRMASVDPKSNGVSVVYTVRISGTGTFTPSSG